MNLSALPVLLIVHLIGDFYLQSDQIAQAKGSSPKAMRTHCLLYAASCTLLVLAALFLGWQPHIALILMTWLALTHWLIDACVKPLLARSMRRPLGLFLSDQALHFACCVIGAYMAGFVSPIPAASMYPKATEILSAMLSMAFSIRPAEIAVRLLLKSMRRQASDKAREETDTALNAGHLIGYFERGIICALTLAGQYDAIAFVVAAKSIARYKKIEEDSEFAEIYLVGTLASVGLSMVFTMVVKALM